VPQPTTVPRAPLVDIEEIRIVCKRFVRSYEEETLGMPRPISEEDNIKRDFWKFCIKTGVDSSNSEYNMKAPFVKKVMNYRIP
jgi:hypothetical protein